jgi:hypothetical protein
MVTVDAFVTGRSCANRRKELSQDKAAIHSSDSRHVPWCPCKWLKILMPCSRLHLFSEMDCVISRCISLSQPIPQCFGPSSGP